MTLPQVNDLFRYWQTSPPADEAALIALRIYTTFGKEEPKPPTQQEIQKSLEARWNAGALNPKQMFEMFGGQPVQAGQPRMN